MSEDPRQTIDGNAVKAYVAQRYASIARGDMTSCCGSSPSPGDRLYTICGMAQGYSEAELAEIPVGADLGLGCGDPTADADLQPGQRVLDLGSGAGVDCFLAARRVGPEGHVIGVDMTDEMVARAHANARRGGYTNVEFRRGEIEDLPVESGTMDRIISNCVINLAPDKARVFAEAFRVLKPGGSITVSDIVSFGEVPASIRTDMEKWAGCMAGAMDKYAYLSVIGSVGFRSVTVLKEAVYDYLRGPDYGFASITVRAVK